MLLEDRVLPRIDICHRTFQMGYSETRTGNVLRSLFKSGELRRDEIAWSLLPQEDARSDAHLYFVRNCRDKEVSRCKRIMHDRFTYITSTTLGDTAELCIRALFYHIRNQGQSSFERITSQARLKRTKIEGKLTRQTGDLKIGYMLRDTLFGLLLEIKSQRKAITFKRGEMAKLIGQAIHNDLMPVMIANRISDTSKRFMTFYGIPFHELNRQFLPNSLRATAEELYPKDILEERFQFVNPNRPIRIRPDRNEELDPRWIRDIAVMSNPKWIELPRTLWVQQDNATLVKIAHKALSHEPIDEDALYHII